MKIVLSGLAALFLQAFFSVYKNIPEGSKKVELEGFELAEKAKIEVASALRAYSEKK